MKALVDESIGSLSNFLQGLVFGIEVLVVFVCEFGLWVVFILRRGWSLKLGDFFLEIAFLSCENGVFADLSSEIADLLISAAAFCFLSYKHKIIAYNLFIYQQWTEYEKLTISLLPQTFFINKIIINWIEWSPGIKASLPHTLHPYINHQICIFPINPKSPWNCPKSKQLDYRSLKLMKWGWKYWKWKSYTTTQWGAVGQCRCRRYCWERKWIVNMRLGRWRIKPLEW